MKINLFHKTRGSTSFKKRIKHHFDLFKYGKFLQIFLMVGFFVGLFFAVNPIHGLGSGYIEVDVGTSDGPYAGSKFIVRDDYGGYREYWSNIDGDIQICVDYDNGRCDLQYQDLGKVFYINQDCVNFSDGKYTCDKSEVKVSIEGDERGEPYARYFYADNRGNPIQELYYAAGDGGYIFNNDGGDCIEIKSKVKALGLEEGQFEFVLRDNYGDIKQTTTNDGNGDIRFCGDYTDGVYLITQNFNNTSNGYIIDSAIIKVNIQDDGYGNKNIQYHKDYYLGNGDNELCFEGEDVNYLNWGYQYQAPSSNYNYYSYNNNYVSFDSWSDWDWNNYVVNSGNGLGYWSDYYDFQDGNGYAFYNKKAPVCIEIETSVDSNKPIQSGQFEFGLYYSNYYYNNRIPFSTAKNNGSGGIIFSELNDGFGNELSEYDSCVDHDGNTQGEYSRMCYDIDGIYGNQWRNGNYNYNFDYLIGQKTYASGCDNYSCDTGTIEVDVSLTCNSMYNCNASLTYSDTGFFNAIYTATFNANGANSIGANMISGATITLPSITRPGYVALGWSTNSGATVAEYSVGQTVTLSGDMTFYAITREAIAEFRAGNTFNQVIKTLAKGFTVDIEDDVWSGDDEIYSGDNELDIGDDEVLTGGTGTNPTAGSVDTGVLQILRTGSIPAGVVTGLLSSKNSEVPVIAWFDDGIIYYYTEASKIYLNENSRFMFYRFKALTNIDTSGRDTSMVESMMYMFGACNSLITVDTSNWDTSNVRNMQRMFTQCNSLTGIDVSNWDTSSVKNMDHMFNYCNNLESLDVSEWDTSSVTNMSNLFYNCLKLTELDVENWDMSNVKDIHAMFSDCHNLRRLNVSKWNTSSVTKMNSMFNDCWYLTGIDLSGRNTSNVTDMHNMFTRAYRLENIDVSHRDTSKVTNMANMFNRCYALQEIDVSDWDTNKVKNMNSMFSYCSGLTELHLLNWDTSNVTDMSGMFLSCRNLETIYVSTGFVTSSLISGDYMFAGAPKLMGGHGTRRDSSIVDKTRAVLDSETQSGYLTYDIAVSYRTRSGVELARQVINVGSSAVAPTITGYHVLGYYSNTGLSSTFDFSQELRTYTEVYVDYGHIATFESNGADSIGASTLSGLSVQAPSITRSGWNILGWSTNPNATGAQYQVGDDITLTGDITLYAITKKTYTVTFVENGADSIGAATGSCDVYNTQTSCGEGTEKINYIGTDITICDENDSTHCITIMDRNLGATESGTGCVHEECHGGREYIEYPGYNSYEECMLYMEYYVENDCSEYREDDGYNSYEECVDSYSYIIEFTCKQDLKGYETLEACENAMETQFNECTITNSGVFGNLYEWGNNYGFSPFGSVTTGNQMVNCDDYGPLNPFSSSTFIIGNRDYCLESNDNLWGDTTNTVEARRGPCDEGYHVPSSEEWSDLMNIWAGTNVNYTDWQLYDIFDDAQASEFQNDLKIPFTSFRSINGEAHPRSQAAGLWSSSPHSDKYAWHFLLNSTAVMIAEYPRVDATPVRCFKDEPTLPSNTSTPLFTPSIERTGWTVLGWSKDSGATQAEYQTGENVVISGDITLYAITSKPASATFSANGNKLDGQTGDVEKDCTMYNTQTGCQITTPTISASGTNTPTVVGYTTTSGGTDTATIGSNTGLLIAGGETYYAQTTAPAVTHTVTFYKNGASTQTNASGTAVTDETVIRTCTRPATFNGSQQDSTCTITSPTIVGTSNTPNIIGYSTGANDHTSTWNHNTAKTDIDSDLSYYAQTQGLTTATYKPNGNLLDGGTSDITKSCTGYNGASTCNVTTPTITNTTTTSVIGYSNSSTSHTSTVGSNATHAISTSGGGTWYAQTKSSKIYATFEIHDRNATYMGSVFSKKYTKELDCTKYNGETSCKITSPSMNNENSSRYTIIGWNTDPNAIESSLTPGDSTYISSDTTYYSITRDNNNSRTITFVSNGNGINGNPSVTAYKYNGEDGWRAMSPGINPPGGFTTIGWSTAQNRHENDWTPGTVKLLANSDPFIYYAQSSKVVSARFIPNNNRLDGGTDQVQKSCTGYNGVSTCTITTPTISNSTTTTVVGYTTSSTATSTASIGSNTGLLIAGGETYYAHTMSPAVTYTANFNANGNTLDENTTSCTIAATYDGTSQTTSCNTTCPKITAPSNTPTIIGFSSASGTHDSGICINQGILILDPSKDGNTYYAQTKKDYSKITVIFDVNNNRGSDFIEECTPETKYNGELGGTCEVNSPDIIPPEGFTIIGWSTSSTRHENDWAPRENKTFSTSATYFAQSRKTVSATFNKNGNLLDGVAENKTRNCRRYNGEGTCGITTPTISNTTTSTVVGYTETAEGTGIATIGSNTGLLIAGGETYYAQTTAPAVTHTVTFYKNGASTQTNASGTAVTDETVIRTCTRPATFNGSQQDSTCTITSPTIVGTSNTPNIIGYSTGANDHTSTWNHNTAKTDIDSDLTYYAQTVTPSIGYTITFDANGANVVEDTDSCTTTPIYNGSTQSPSCTVEAKAITRDEWEIIGWNTNNGATQAEYEVGDDITLTGDIILYAITKKDVTITFDSNGGTPLGGQSVTLYSDMTVTGQMPSNPTKLNSVFLGWYLSGSETEFDFSTTRITGDISLIAKRGCDTGYRLDTDGETCIPLTYVVRHFIKNPGELSYTLSGTEVFTGIAGERVNLSDFSRTYPSCIVYSRGSLTGDESGPLVVVTGGNIAGDGTTVINLYYDRNTYTVQLEKDLFTSTVEGAGTYECGATVNISAVPETGYHFYHWEVITPMGWNSNLTQSTTSFVMPDFDVELKAVSERDVYYGGGGGGGGLKKDNCPGGDYSSSRYDGDCGSDPKSNTGEDDNIIHGSAGGKCSIAGSEYTDELNDAYQYACSVGITTMDTIQKADMVGPLLRKHLAKMVSEFSVKELGMEPDKDKVCEFDDMGRESSEMQKYAEMACQLGFMGLHSDGIQVKDNFDPNNYVTRAEFGTVLSRLFWGTKYATDNGKLFYKYHLEALKSKGIMTQIYGNWPSSIELRGYVMLMLMRVSGLDEIGEDDWLVEREADTHNSAGENLVETEEKEPVKVDEGNIHVSFKGFKNGEMTTTGDYVHIIGALDPSQPVVSVRVTHTDTKGKSKVSKYKLSKYEATAHYFWFNASKTNKTLTMKDRNTYLFEFYDANDKLLFKKSVVIIQK